MFVDVAAREGIPIELRTALFGHGPEKIAKRYYTDMADVTCAAKAFEAL